MALFVDLLWLLLLQEAFIKVMKLSVSILEADSVHLCHLQLCFSIDRIRSIYGHKQIWMTSYVMETALHVLTNKMVPDANSFSIEELPEVATLQNNVEYRLNYNKFYQGCIDCSFIYCSFCGDGPLDSVIPYTFHFR